MTTDHRSPPATASNRAAAVARGPQDDTMPSPGVRKLTITLTIVIVVAAHAACGFSLYRRNTAEVNSGILADQASQESFQIDVKNDPKSPNYLKLDKSGDTNKAIKNKLRFTSDLKFIDSVLETTANNKNDAILETTTLDISTNQKEKSEVPATSSSITENTNERIKTTSSDNDTSSGNTVSPTSESLSKNIDSLHSTKPIKTEADLETSKNNTNSGNTTYLNDEIIKENEEMSTTETLRIHDQLAIDSETTENLLDQKDTFPNSTTININENGMRTAENETEPNIMRTTSVMNSKDNNLLKTSSSESTVPDIFSSTEYITTKSLNATSELADVSIRASIFLDLVNNVSNPITTEPSWKKYTTIERKRFPSSDETSTSTEKPKDMVKAESIQTTLPIPSLQMLREDLLSNAYQPSTIRQPETGNVTFEMQTMPTLGSIESTQSETLGTVASKRAGFLDLSKISSAQYEKSSIGPISDPYNSNEKNAANFKTEGNEKVNGFESQSRLADDAMNEELMKEEMIFNNEENLNKYEGANIDEVQPLVRNKKPVETSTSQSVTEDSLSVQPINQDRRTTLYTVGPNYKPMKRIDVQPVKLFVRDPDDNSWRNESISSLGIVFKPKNSSTKSYKEVLKNKTETEFNNLQDKDNKDETPELRIRLEKIAEVRKSKKKRIDKFGEVVYTDYEEGSAEGSSTAPPGSTPALNSSETLSLWNLETEITSPMTTENQSYWKTKLETISKEEMFKDLGLDILTTPKPKKPNNLAEYYDTTDEYDADYITLSKIDLKKFKVAQKIDFSLPSKTTYSPLTSPPLPPTTRLMPPRFPDRQPTVQYFPPTTKPQKVNINDYDVNFERRVKQYTLQETPKTVPPFDPARVPVATDRPTSRPTEKPSEFARYTPEHPNKHLYLSSEPRVTDQNFVIDDANFNRGMYVIKHFKDFLDVGAKDEDKSLEFVPYPRPPSRYTEPPARGVTVDELARASQGKTTEADYEYDTDFRKDVINRFVDNFNHNSDRFKADFPVLFNSSVVHRLQGDHGPALASSSTFVKRLYGSQPPAPAAAGGCEPHCDNVTVELSPAYELHYYVPEEEEKQLAERTVTLPRGYNL